MNRIPGITLIFCLIIFSISCKKDNNTQPTDVPSIINFTKPNAGIIYPNGTVLSIEGLMIDDNGLTTATLEIRNKTTGAILNQQTSTTGNVTAYNFTWNWTVTGMTAQITGTVKVIAKDRLGNNFSKEIDVTLSN